MVNELHINQKIMRKGSLREVYSIKEKKVVNNILHYIIKSKHSNELILSEYAIKKDFITEQDFQKHKKKRSFIKQFQERIKNYLPSGHK